MLLYALKNKFKAELLDYYPETEISSFFYLLTADILNLKPIDVALNKDEVVSNESIQRLVKAINKLKRYEPIQYIIGKTEFYDLYFEVNKSVLIPRPETEELVHWIITDNKTNKPFTLLDIGTGSGCIAISLAKHLKNAKVCALDVSEKALELAKTNSNINNVEVEYILGDILNFNPEQEFMQFDVIVSNPPYVRQLEKQEIDDNVLKHEPHLALFVQDEDALVFYRAILEFSKKYLKINGYLYFEINEYLGREMKDLLSLHNYNGIQLKQDLFGKDRMIKAQKK